MRGIMDPGKEGSVREEVGTDKLAFAGDPVDIGKLGITTDQNKKWGIWSQGMIWRTKVDQPAGGISFNTDSYMVQAGVDRSFYKNGGRAVFGGLFGHAESTAKPQDTRSESDLYFGGLYGSYFSDKGWYADLTGRLGHVSRDSSSDSNTITGNYGGLFEGLELTGGYRRDLEGGIFIEPEGELIGGHLDGFDMVSADGARYKGSGVWTFMASGSLRSGTVINVNDLSITPYIKGGYLYSKSSSSNLTANEMVIPTSSTDGDYWLLGGGIGVEFKNHLGGYAEYGYMTGANIEQPYRVTIGAKYRW